MMEKRALGPHSRADTGKLAADRVAKCLAREPGAWASLVGAYGDLVYSVLLKKGLIEPDLEETFQIVFVAAYENLASLRDPRKFVPWLIGIASRRAVDTIRAKSRKGRLEERVHLETSAEPVGGQEALLDLERLEDAQRLHELLANLSERCRRLIAYFFFDDPPKSYDDVSGLEAIPRGSVGPTRQRCLAHLRAAWEQEKSG